MPTVLNMIASVLLAADAEPAPTGLFSLLGPLFPFLMIAVLFYLLMIRPERRKRAVLAAMLDNLKKNDRVVASMAPSSMRKRTWMKSSSRWMRTRIRSCGCSAPRLPA
jgi:hypothetical protein